jgi:predicted ester cyclase
MAFRPGFDVKWTSEEDFILGITREIWEDRGIGTLERYYAPDLVVRSPASVVVGNGGIIAATLATLAEFPDRQLPGEDVIWAEVSPTAFLSSHRLYCSATHSGRGMYGDPTGRKLGYRIIADCFCEANAVTDEWLVRDQGAIVRQMGEDPKDWTARLIAREGGPEACVKPFTPARDVPGPYTGGGNDHPVGQKARDVLERMMSGDFALVAESYDRACELHYAGHLDAHGHDAAIRHWLGLRAAFPSAVFAAHHVIGMDSPGMPPRAALRWSLDGRHDGPGAFGTPTGAHVHVMGMTHVELGPRGIRREWTLIDETAVWKQILLATG